MAHQLGKAVSILCVPSKHITKFSNLSLLGPNLGVGKGTSAPVVTPRALSRLFMPVVNAVRIGVVEEVRILHMLNLWRL